MTSSLGFRNLDLRPDILPPHSPRKDKTADPCASSQVEHPVHIHSISHQHVGQVISQYNIPESGCAGGNHDLETNRGRIYRDQRFQTVGEDRVRKAEEHGPAKDLTKHDQSRCDGNLRRWEGVLDGDDWLWSTSTVSRRSRTRTWTKEQGGTYHLQSGSAASSQESLVSYPLSC